MSKALSLKLQDDIFEEVEAITRLNHIPRNTYINKALALYNQINKRKSLREKLKVESRLVGESSLAILKEFEAIE